MIEELTSRKNTLLHYLIKSYLKNTSDKLNRLILIVSNVLIVYFLNFYIFLNNDKDNNNFSGLFLVIPLYQTYFFIQLSFI